MEDNNNTNEIKYYIAHEGDVVHNGELMPRQYVTTGLANLEIFENEQEYKNRLNELQGK